MGEPPLRPLPLCGVEGEVGVEGDEDGDEDGVGGAGAAGVAAEEAAAQRRAPRRRGGERVRRVWGRGGAGRGQATTPTCVGGGGDTGSPVCIPMARKLGSQRDHLCEKKMRGTACINPAAGGSWGVSTQKSVFIRGIKLNRRIFAKVGDWQTRKTIGETRGDGTSSWRYSVTLVASGDSTKDAPLGGRSRTAGGLWKLRGTPHTHPSFGRRTPRTGCGGQTWRRVGGIAVRREEGVPLRGRQHSPIPRGDGGGLLGGGGDRIERGAVVIREGLSRRAFDGTLMFGWNFFGFGGVICCVIDYRGG